MNPESKYLAGIDLGGSRVKAVAITPAGSVLRREIKDFDTESTMQWAEGIRGILLGFTRDFGRPPLATGLSAPGLASVDERRIAAMPGRLQGLEGLDWTGFLQTETPVRVLNDAHAALLGEAWLGAARGRRNAAMLTLGTGVGGALLLDGKLFRGHLGRAGHLGHVTLDSRGRPDITGMPGSLEDAIGNCTLVERSGGLFKSTEDLVRAHIQGDAGASAIWLGSVRELGCALASIINVVDPEVIVIGGGIARAGDALFIPMRAVLAEFEWRPSGVGVEIVAAALEEFAGAFGAAIHSWRD